jgi:hypothetical protein
MDFLFLLFVVTGALVFACLRGSKRQIDHVIYENLPRLYLICALAPPFLFRPTPLLLVSCSGLAVSSLYIIKMRRRARRSRW